MDMGTSMTMSMPMSSMASATGTATKMMSGMSMGTSTAMAAMSTSTGAMDMGGMGMGGDCKISMLWNWYTIDACFLSSTWHITSKGMFAGSCIGVVALVCVLEFLRRAGREYDRFLLQSKALKQSEVLTQHTDPSPNKIGVTAAESSSQSTSSPERGARGLIQRTSVGSNRPTVVQQVIRSLIHMLQFAVAYFIMLLAMYYNGYVIICIFIGAFVGSFIFGWDLGMGQKQEPSGCCG